MIHRRTPRLLGAFVNIFSFLLFACSVTGFAAEGNRPADAFAPSATAAASAAQQPWQKRRAAFEETVKRMRANEESARKEFEAVLTEFEKQPFSRTPIENMDILGVKSTCRRKASRRRFRRLSPMRHWVGTTRCDSLLNPGGTSFSIRKASFRRAYVITGTEMSQRAVQFFGDNPDLAAALVAKGIAVAERFKDDPRYDHKWPSAYGEEARACAKDPQCPGLYSVPDTRWLDVWEDAKQRVMSYYRLNKPGARGGDSPKRP